MSSKSKIVRISLIVALVLSLALTLSACNFFDGMTKITSVNVEATSGLADSNGDGIYEIYSGESFTLTVSWNNKLLINKPTIKWFASQNGGEKQEVSGQTAATLTTSLSGSVGATIDYSASANSVQSSNSIKIIIVARPSGGGGQGGGEGGEGGEGGGGGEGGEGGDPPAPSISFTVETSGTSAADSDGYVGAKYGKQFAVSVNLGGQTIISPVYEWYVKEDGVQRQLEGAGESINFTISSRSIAKYEFWAVLKLDEDMPSTNTAKVKFVESTLIVNSIDCTSHTIAQGMVQQNINDGLENVVLTAVWNEDEIPEDLVTFTWSVDDVQQVGETSKTFTFDVGSISSACEKTVKVTARFKGQYAPTISIKLSFVEEYLPIDKVSVAVTQTVDVKQVIEHTTFKRIVDGTSDTAEITFSANILPAGANITAPVTWTVRDASGTHALLETSNVLTTTLAHGKNVVTATVENVPSRSVMVYVLTNDEFNDRKYAINGAKSTFVWNGSTQDHYINNQEELDMLVGYIVSTHATESSALTGDTPNPNTHQMYLAPSAWRDGVNTTPAFAEARSAALHNGMYESGTPGISTYGNRYMYLSSSSVLGEPTAAYTPLTPMEQRNVYVRYKEIDSYSSNKRSKVPSDDFTETMLVKNSNQLMRAIEWGYKPTYEDNATGDALEALYYRARSVLLKYVGKDMTELEKVKVIYDWLVNEVVYDYSTAAYEGDDGINYYAYYLEGVFNFLSIDSNTGWDARAVCDGKSKAFVLLCGMEGIHAARIIGTAGQDANPENWGGHAWNKVLVDTDDDGVREWCVVDCTWGDNALTIGSDTKETLTYEYFLVTDEAIEANHASSMAQPVANYAYDPYADTEIVLNIAGDKVSLLIESKDQAIALKNYSMTHDWVWFQVKTEDASYLSVVNLSQVLLGDGIYYIHYAS